MMTTTISAQHPRSAPHRFRRDVIAALAGATLFAASALAMNRIIDDDSRPVGVQGATATVNPGAATPLQGIEVGVIGLGPDAATPAVVDSPPIRLVVNQASSEACGMGHADACPFAHTWVPVDGLDGTEVTQRDLEHVL